MNLFEKRNPDKKEGILRHLLPLLPFALILELCWYGFGLIGEETLMEQEKNLRDYIGKSVTHSYAVDGAYPPSISYIEEKYGLTYDKDLFFIDYRPIGDNIPPDVTVLRKPRKTEGKDLKTQ